MGLFGVFRNYFCLLFRHDESCAHKAVVKYGHGGMEAASVPLPPSWTNLEVYYAGASTKQQHKHELHKLSTSVCDGAIRAVFILTSHNFRCDFCPLV